MKKRQCERIYPKRHSAAFGVGNGGWLAPARVIDYSETGIGLEVRGVCHAGFGDSIRITDSHDHQARHARVVRVSTETRKGRRLTKLGCRWITSSDRRSHRYAHHGRHIDLTTDSTAA